MSAGIIWFRNDLRVEDNVVLDKALKIADKIYPVYIFNPKEYANNELGFPKVGPHRMRFIIEAVHDLRQSLQKLGSNIIVRIGEPVKIISELAQEVGAKYVFAGKEATSDEVRQEERMNDALSDLGVIFELYWHSTLYHIDDIPWPIAHLPEMFTEFRKELESESEIRTLCQVPASLNAIESIPEGDIPEVTDLGLEEIMIDKRGVLKFEGGEKQAWKRLKYYLWAKDQLRYYKETRNGMLGADYSSKLSPWLSIGCISPRSIYYEVKEYEAKRIKNESTYWLVFELLWRDYFKFVAKKHQSNLFKITGVRNREKEFIEDKSIFMNWVNGTTSEPFANANMTELKRTGYMSNRGRQNVASFLVNNLKINWTWGASYFESALIDYDPASNWGNWNYLAGVGNDPRPYRYFDLGVQSMKYDPDGSYVKVWDK